jgi:hypothetical protein
LKNLSPGTEAVDGVPQLSEGDLVMCKVPAELATLRIAAMCAVIVAKVNPIYDIKDDGWVVAR